MDTSGDVWVYRPELRKTEHHGRERIICIGPKGQDVLRPYLLRTEGAYCFSPIDSERKRLRVCACKDPEVASEECNFAGRWPRT